ncbi:glycosyl hydrolase family 28-related protein [Inquilinus limosus]|uniref:glycosyl hydrolase family 28-related protein n=1 Tax=Inquilinus limosus TaxID=171674 RepID=UPI00040B44AF|nr:glycosyl hydrolase family 28-related protein [Inquilinus limosus]
MPTITNVQTVATIQDLTQICDTCRQAEVPIEVRGYWSDGDGGGGLFRWSPGDTAADDMGMVIAPATAGNNPGRWRRITSDSTVNVRWFGARADNTTDDHDRIQKALDTKKNVFLPAGYYLIRSPLILKIHGQQLSGCSPCDTTHNPLDASTAEDLKKTKTVIIVDAGCDGIQNTSSLGSQLTVSNLHIVSTIADATNGWTGINLSIGTFNKALTGRDCKVLGVAIWNFRYGVSIGSSDPANIEPNAWGWRLQDVKTISCAVGFRINGMGKIGWAAQSIMDSCSALLNYGSYWIDAGVDARGCHQIGGDVQYNNCRFEGYQRNFVLESGYATLVKPALESAYTCIISATSDSRLTIVGGYGTIAADTTRTCFMLKVYKAPDAPRDLMGNISLTDFDLTDNLWFNTGTSMKLKALASLDEPADVRITGLTIRKMAPQFDTPAKIFDVGTAANPRYTPLVVAFAGGPDDANYYKSFRYVANQPDLSGSSSANMTRLNDSPF